MMLVSGNVFAEDCERFNLRGFPEAKQQCRIANALEKIAEKMYEPKTAD